MGATLNAPVGRSLEMRDLLVSQNNPHFSEIEERGVAPMQKVLDQEEIQRLAYRFWLERGCPVGSPEQDWFRAEEEMGREEPPIALGADGSI